MFIHGHFDVHFFRYSIGLPWSSICSWLVSTNFFLPAMLGQADADFLGRLHHFKNMFRVPAASVKQSTEQRSLGLYRHRVASLIVEFCIFFSTHDGSMVLDNIWGILMVNVTIYSRTMDPMGYSWHIMAR